MKIPWVNRAPRRLERNVALLTAGLLAGAVIFSGENFLERLFIDLRFFIAASLRPQESVSDQIALVTMDPASEDILKVPQGTRWRQFHPALMEKLGEAGASLVVFDAKFIDSEKDLDPGLARAFVRAGNVIAGEDIPNTTVEALRPAFLALGDLRMKSIGGIPRFVSVTAPTGAALKPLSMVAAEEYGRRTGTPLSNKGVLRSPGFWINFGEKPGYFPSFSYAAVLRARAGRIANEEKTPLSVFSKRIVFIGLDDPSSGDQYRFPNSMGTLYPGVYGHAYATDAILRNRPVLRASPVVDAGITLVFLAALLLILAIKPRSTRTILLVFLPIVAFLVSQVLLSAQGAWIGYAPLFVSYWVVLILHWTSVRISLAASLSRAVGFDPQLIEAFRRESARTGGPVRKDVAILIADIRDYTSYVSSTDPSIVAQVMAEYNGAMERCITALGGYVNKYIGDEVVAVFGFPLDPERCAERAVRSGIAMLEELGKLVASWKERGLACVQRIGIGIDTGPVIFTEVGGRTKNQFDIIGDCINGASRIEHLTKEFKQSLLISDETYRGLESEDALSGSFAPLRTVAVRGQGERRIFGLL